MHRKILTPAFHFKILEQFVDVFNRNGEIFWQALSKVPEDTTFDVYEHVKMYALDNICGRFRIKCPGFSRSGR